MANCELPHDIVFNILLWLPVKPLIRFKSVCKSWYYHIGTSSFINQHMLLRQHQSSSLICYDADPEHEVLWCLLSGENFLFSDLTADLPLYQLRDILTLVGSCNGIICIILESVDRVALWNPATKEVTLIPESPIGIRGEQGDRMKYGFGYACKTNDYKVLRFCHTYEDLILRSARLEIYSLQADSWIIYAGNIDDCSRILMTGLSWNGLYFWTKWDEEYACCDENYSLLSFDLNDEVFQTMAFPDLDAIRTKSHPQEIFVVNDCIAFADHLKVYNTVEVLHFDIWLLKEYGFKESWSKVYTIGPLGPFNCTGNLKKGFLNGNYFVFFQPDDEFEENFQLALCDPGIQEMKFLRFQGLKFVWGAVVYKESLVSIKRGN